MSGTATEDKTGAGTGILGAVRNFIHQQDGPLTQELIRTPGRFGLGQVPARLKPDATTDMVCGYCSTGCSLRIHLKDGEAVNLTPTTKYPVNLGMACPKGWEALSVLDADDRATTPLLRDSSGELKPVSWGHGDAVLWRVLQGDRRRARPRVGGVPQHGATRHRRDGDAWRAR